MSESEVARLKAQIAAEYTAAKLGLSGLSYGTTQHQFITHHMDRMGQHLAILEALVGEDEVPKILAETLELL